MLQVPTDFPICGPTLLNDAEQLAASCQSPSGLSSRAVFWGILDRGSCHLALAHRRNRRLCQGHKLYGVVVGYSRGSIYQPVRWMPSNGGWTFQVMPHTGQGGRASGLNDPGFAVGSVVNKNGTSRPAFWTPDNGLRLLATTSRGEGVALGISAGTSGFAIGGKLVTGKSVTDHIAVRWHP